MKTSGPRLLRLAAGFLSGALWFLVPLSFDHGWGIPPGPLGRSVGLACAMATGAFISALFGAAFRRAPSWAFLLLPCVTLPAAVVIFSLLLGLGRLTLGIRFSPPPASGDLRLLAESYLFYGILGAGPVLYPFALLNQWALRALPLLNRDA